MEYLIQDATLTDIADAIRAKTGGTAPIPVTDMATQIAAITGGGTEETLTTLFEEKPCNGFSLDSTYGVYTVNVGSAYTLVVGESYIVEWDGETYNCVAQDLSFLAAGVVGLGNFADFGGTGNGEPFGFLYSATGCTICALDTATAHDVGLYQKQSSGGGSVEGIVYVTFMNGDVELCKTACMKGDCSIDPVECAKIAVPTKEPTVDTVYTYAGGWALTEGGEADVMALVDVSEDRVVYAVYTESAREYTINFYDDDGTTLLESLQVPYGEVPSPTEPKKDGFRFDGWSPELSAVTADADYQALWVEGGAFSVTDFTLGYGVEWDYSQSATALTRIGLASGFSDPAPATSLAAAGSSPFDNVMPWAGMKRYNIIDGAIAYSEDDAGFSMTDYDTVVYIPPFYYAAYKDEANTKWRWSISPVEKEGYALHPGSGRYIGRYHTSGSSSAVYSKSGVQPLVSISRANFRTYSHNKGDNWWMLDIATWSALQLLFLVEFANFNSQNKLGKGNGSESQASGSTNNAVYHTYNGGSTTNQYRWIEQPWGRVVNFADGALASARAVYLGTNNSTFDDEITVLEAAEITLPSSGLITGFGYSDNFPWAMVPDAASGGSASTYVPDNVNTGDDTFAWTVGGNFSGSDNFGLFFTGATAYTTVGTAWTGSRLIYIP